MEAPTDLQAFCREILARGDLPSKLRPPPEPGPDWLAPRPGPLEMPSRQPAREVGLRMRAGAGPLPRPGTLSKPEARAICLARFAHHELMAVELFAWALLRWPEVAPELRVGWLKALADEQIHCGLYLDRLRDHGSCLEDHVLSDYFWQHVPAMETSPRGPLAFLAAMGLTLEQANLDFSLLYRDAFREAGDEQSAAVLQRVYDDEVRHVALAAEWMLRLSPEYEGDQVAAYDDSVPFPLAAHRAKGRRFEPAGRRAAGLSEELIDHVRKARSSQELAGSKASLGESS